jgi:hypothetical protein
MPSSYTASARFTLQATGENNNTWGVILNNGVFQLVDDAMNGRLGISLSGAHTLTVNLGATDEARMSFIDVTGGSGGVLTAPSVPKAYFVHNGSSGIVGLSAGGATLNFNPGDAGPVHTDGTTFYPVLVGGLTVKGYVDAGDAAQKAYTDAQIAGSVINMPSVTGHAGQVLSNDGSIAFWSGAVVKTVSGKVPDANYDVDIEPYRNRIINGDFRIDQRHAGANLIPTATSYIIDRWQLGVTQASKIWTGRNFNGFSPPGPLIGCLGAQVTATAAVGAVDYFILNQTIEGIYIADFGFGHAGASPITLSFQATASVAGTYGGCIRNGVANRSYPFTFTVTTANAWAKTVITIPGDTVGTWATDNTAGLILSFSLGAGATVSGPPGAWAAGNYVTANGAASLLGIANANLYIAGVQLEVGSQVSTFERRPYAFEKTLCQRYYENNFPDGTAPANGVANPGVVAMALSASQIQTAVNYQTTKRALAAVTTYYGAAAAGTPGLWNFLDTSWKATTSVAFPFNSVFGFRALFGATVVAQGAYFLDGCWAADAEL